MHKRLTMAVAIAATLPLLIAAKPAPTTVEVGVDVTEWNSDTALDVDSGIFPIRGSGQLNGEFVVAEQGDVQIGLRITDRTDGLLEASGNHVGTYHASTGHEPNSTELAEWNYDWHVDLRDSGTTLADYDLTLQTDIATPLFGDHGTLDLKFPAAFGDLLEDAVLYQSSQNPVFGNDTFDPTAEGTYSFTLRLAPKDGGRPLMVHAKVHVTD